MVRRPPGSPRFPYPPPFRSAEARLSRLVLRSRAGAEEGGQSNGDQDADDENDHHELDQREARLLVPALHETLEHVRVTSLRRSEERTSELQSQSNIP